MTEAKDKMKDFEQNTDYLRRAVKVLETISGNGVKFQQIFDAGGEYWVVIRKDFIARGIFRPLGTDGNKVAPENKELIQPTLAHFRYLLSEREKAERNERIDMRIKKSGAWTGWLAIVISAISLLISTKACSEDREPTPTSQNIGTPASPSPRKTQDSCRSLPADNPPVQNRRTVSCNSSDCGNAGASKVR